MRERWGFKDTMNGEKERKRRGKGRKRKKGEIANKKKEKERGGCEGRADMGRDREGG